MRFSQDVAEDEQLQLLERGATSYVGTFDEHPYIAPFAGNVIDLCPVGALTSRPYEFRGRPWELRKIESIDVMDAVGSNIRLDARGREVMRILPRTHEDVNEEWISDKTRFACDGLRRQRLDRPYVRRNGKLQPATSVTKRMQRVQWMQRFIDVLTSGPSSLSGTARLFSS